MDWAHVMTFIAGLFSGYTIKTIVSVVNKKNVRFTSQKGNVVNGDMVAGDKKTLTK